MRVFWKIIMWLFIIGIAIRLLPFFILICLIVLVLYGCGFIYANRYFKTDKFKSVKNEFSIFIKDSNELNAYAESIINDPDLMLGSSNSGKYAHHAKYENTSVFAYVKNRHDRDLVNVYTHNCSLSVVDGARRDPISYVMRYFGLNATDQNLLHVETFGTRMDRMNEAVENLKSREKQLLAYDSFPFIIKTFYGSLLSYELGFTSIPIVVKYPIFTFEYVSAGGNSSDKVTIETTPDFIDDLIYVMGDKIDFRKSIAGQRALMTNKLRQQIKDRDNHTCQSCGLSVFDEPNLLLEIDHIQPLAKGGLTIEDNLQTLCWKCNRSKGVKIIDS